MWLVAASSLFYMYFVPAYILILLVTIIIDYFAGIWIEKSEGQRRKNFLILSLIGNVGILFFFKYFNFAMGNAQLIAQLIGWNYTMPALEILLPIGLSFHTFQAMSYTIEVYCGNQKAERHFGIYALYVLFFPQLVAGPIERPQNLLHQFHEPHTLKAANVLEGLKLMLYGLLLKVVIADRLAVFVDLIYGKPESYDGPLLLLATIAFAFQLLGDFGGYSLIAIGSARTMGIHLMKNFDRPYHATSIADFWRRWHISLSTWLKDYVYDSLLMTEKSITRTRIAAALLCTFFISGLWHGANWTYVIFGTLNGIYLVVSLFTRQIRQDIVDYLGLEKFPILLNAYRRLITFLLVCVSYIFFRSSSVQQAWYILTHLFQGWGKPFVHPEIYITNFSYSQLLILMVILIGFELFESTEEYFPNKLRFEQKKAWVRWPVYAGLAWMILNLGTPIEIPFIYFQF